MTLSILIGFFGQWEVLWIVLAILILFGGRKIPELMRGLGQGMKEFKNASGNEESTDHKKGSKKDSLDSKKG